MQSPTSLAPPAIRWTAERGERGGGVSGGARCTVRGCAVRFSSGDDRPCPDHRPPDDDGGYRRPDDGGGYRWSGDPSEADNDAVRDAERLAKRRADRAAPGSQRAVQRRAETTEAERAAAAAARRDRFNARRRADRAAAAQLRAAAAERAAAWLLRYLAERGGRASHRTIVIAAEDAGHPSAALRAARRMLALHTVRSRGHRGDTDWVLPGAAAADRAAEMVRMRVEADQDAQRAGADRERLTIPAAAATASRIARAGN